MPAPEEPASLLWLCTAKKFGRCCVEILEQGRAKPAFHVELRGEIPIPAVFLTSPFQFYRVAGKRIRGENQTKTVFSARNGGNQLVNHGIHAENERFPRKTDGSIIKDPHSLVFVWCENAK